MKSPLAQRLMTYALILGVLGVITSFVLPLLLTKQVQEERARLAACEREERIDCQSSVIWLLLK